MKKNIFISVPITYLQTEKKLIEKHRFNLELKIFSYDIDEITLKSFIDMANFKNLLNLRVSIHAPFVDLSPGGFDEKIRKVTENRFLRVLDIALLFSPENIVFHPGYNEIIHGQFFDIWEERSKVTWKKIINYAEEVKQKISFENIFEKNTKVLETLIDITSSTIAGVCVDVGHHNVFSETPVETYFKKFRDRIFEIHLHDNNGDFDWHKAIGEGNIDFINIVKLIKKYSPNAILTLEPHDKDTLFRSLSNFERILECVQ